MMKLVESALRMPPDDRKNYLRSACGADDELFAAAWNYVQWEQRMDGFLLDPLCSRQDHELSFHPGDLLESRFRIVREVAQGGMGIVYEAIDLRLDRRIALKCAKRGFGKRLPPEVRNASDISHPNICKIFEIHTATTSQGEIDFLTMEFLDGETLKERLNRGPLTANEAHEIGRQLCAGLAEAHRNRVIHGDLKSNNVILTRAGDGKLRAVITDFGLARRPEISQSTWQSGQLVGTPDYMAPELWRGEKASVASDIYALGVILQEMVSQERPAAGEIEGDLIRKSGKPSSRWHRTVQRCLDPNPEKRFQHAESVALAVAPLNTRRWLLVSALASILAVVSGFISYRTATAPRETIRLAVLPFNSVGQNLFLSEVLSKNIGETVAHLSGNARTRLIVVPQARVLRNNVTGPDKARTVLNATHVLQGTVTEEQGRLILHSYLIDTRTGMNSNEWNAEYAPGESRHIPTALAGMVTGTFHLPPLIANVSVNSSARRDYMEGLESLRWDSRTDAALTSLERAVAADPDSPLTHAALAEAKWFKYYLSRDLRWLERASQSSREAERRNPDLAAVHRVAGLLLQNSGFYERAVAAFLRSLELEPRNGDAFRRLGRVYQINDRLDEAMAAYRRATELDPMHYRNHQALGNLYFERANYAEAIKHWKRTIELAPREPEAHIVLASAYLNTGRFPDSESELRTALGLTESPKALHTLGLVLMYQRRYQEAIPYLLRALDQWPERHRLWTHLASCYRRTRALAEAEKADRRALDLVERDVTQQPRDATMRSGLAYLCARTGDRRRAESEVAQALYLAPHDADTRWWAALTYEALGKRDATLALLTSSSNELIADLSRWPEVEDLHKDSRFKDLLRRHQTTN